MAGPTLGGSLRILGFKGIDVHVHWTFLLLVGYVAVTTAATGAVLREVLLQLAYVGLVFACVVLHEYGHALTALRYGVRTRDITLLPIGGVARLERLPSDPVQELVVAIAGPLVNVIIAGALGVGMLLGGMPLLTPEWIESPNFFQAMLVVNVMLVLFNLLPAFPMDGGRVLRALLAMVTDPLKATRIAAFVGRGMAVVFAVVAAVAWVPMLFLIAAFVWFGAGGEARAMAVRSLLDRIPVARAMLTEFHTLAPADPLARAAQLVIAGSQQDFPVVADGRVVGVLERERLFTALTQSGELTPAADVMTRNILVVPAAAPLEEALLQLQNSGAPMAAVEHGGRLTGILTLENAAEFLRLRQAQTGRRRVPPVVVPPPLPK